jgi:hypothetical protein
VRPEDVLPEQPTSANPTKATQTAPPSSRLNTPSWLHECPFGGREAVLKRLWPGRGSYLALETVLSQDDRSAGSARWSHLRRRRCTTAGSRPHEDAVQQLLAIGMDRHVDDRTTPKDRPSAL